tara:strand:- start:25183 stop:25953 length:771 start_codon:yes stop_codon:yes gene_type:complete
MAINIDEMYRFVQFVANKEQSGFIKPTEFNLAVDRAQMQLFMERYNNPAEYQPGRAIPRVAYQQTQKISDDLRMFIKRVMLPINADGMMNYPDDYIHFSKATYRYLSEIDLDDGSANAGCVGCSTAVVGQSSTSTIEKTVGVKPVDDGELNKLLSSSIVAPTLDYPILAFFEDGIQYYPKDLSSVELTYLHRPIVPNWASTIVNDRPIYNPGASTDLEWAEQVFNEIAIRILAFVGVNLRESELAQYSEGKRQTGI